MWASGPGVASPQPRRQGPVFIISAAWRAPPARLAGTLRRRPGVRKLKTWPRTRTRTPPPVNTSLLLLLKRVFPTRMSGQLGKGGGRRTILRGPSTHSPRLPTPRVSAPRCPAGAKAGASPAPGSALAPSAAGREVVGEVGWDGTTDNPGARALCTPNPTPLGRELRSAARLAGPSPPSTRQRNGPHGRFRDCVSATTRSPSGSCRRSGCLLNPPPPTRPPDPRGELGQLVGRGPRAASPARAPAESPSQRARERGRRVPAQRGVGGGNHTLWCIRGWRGRGRNERGDQGALKRAVGSAEGAAGETRDPSREPSGGAG